MKEELECSRESIPVCPHCGHQIHEAWDYRLDDEESTEDDCGECGAKFKILCHVDVSYTTSPIGGWPEEQESECQRSGYDGPDLPIDHVPPLPEPIQSKIISPIPEFHPQPGVGRCGFCEHYEGNQFHFSCGTCRLDGDGRSYDLDHCDQFKGNPCDCHACANVRGRGSRIFVLCPTCGNKRCPKASNHELECTASNEPGQKGSVYE